MRVIRWLSFALMCACTHGKDGDDGTPNDGDPADTDVEATESDPPVDTDSVDSDAPDPDDTDVADTDGPDTDLPDTDVAPPEPTWSRISGEITWHIDFRRANQQDCSYTRRYEGVEDPTYPWACPTCGFGYASTVTLVAGQDCFERANGLSQIAPFEVLGLGDGHFWRMDPGPSYPYGTLVEVADGWDLTTNPPFDLPTPVGHADMVLEGHLDRFVETGPPPNAPLVAPAAYACGWPKADPPVIDLPYGVITPGDMLPDGLFPDTCSEPVRLHDFAGRYLVIDVAAPDCWPCQVEAEDIDDLQAWATRESIDLEVITLLSASLSLASQSPSLAAMLDWQAEYGLTGPVLADRGYGAALGRSTFEDAWGFPTAITVAPDLTILDVTFGIGTMQSAQAAIQAHAGP